MVHIIVLSFAFLLSLDAKAENTKPFSQDTCYEIYDPAESVNRVIFKGNLILFMTVLNPALTAYETVVPTWVQKRVSCFTEFLRLPLTLVNNILQLDSVGASKTVGRFVTNAIWGVGGLFDVADQFGVEKRTQTFADTLGHYNPSYGAYIVVPIFGPSTARDFLGAALTIFVDPLYWISQTRYNIIEDNIVKVQYFDTHKALYYNDGLVYWNKLPIYRDIIMDVGLTGIDPYSRVRSTYIQYFANANRNCKDKQAVDYSEDN